MFLWLRSNSYMHDGAPQSCIYRPLCQVELDLVPTRALHPRHSRAALRCSTEPPRPADRHTHERRQSRAQPPPSSPSIIIKLCETCVGGGTWHHELSLSGPSMSAVVSSHPIHPTQCLGLYAGRQRACPYIHVHASPAPCDNRSCPAPFSLCSGPLSLVLFFLFRYTTDGFLLCCLRASFPPPGTLACRVMVSRQLGSARASQTTGHASSNYIQDRIREILAGWWLISATSPK